MEKLYEKIEKYLAKNFPSKKIVLNNSLKESSKTELWGFNKIIILAKETEEIIEYNPIFKN